MGEFIPRTWGKVSRGSPLGVVAYRVWGPVIQSPARGRPTIVGGLPPPLLRGRYPCSPRRLNSYPFLLTISISPVLCARPRGYGAGSAADSTPSPVPSPVIPYGVIRLVCRYSIVFVVVVVALKISTLHTSYQQLPPTNKKSGFFSCFTCPIWTNRRSRCTMKWTLEWELRFKRVHFCTSFWRRPHAINPKMSDPVQICNKKSQGLPFVRPFSTYIFKTLKCFILNIGLDPLIKYGGIYNINYEIFKVCIYHKWTILMSKNSKILYRFNPMIDELFLTL